MTTKISTAQTSVVAAKGAVVIRTLVTKLAASEAENTELRTKLATRERDDHVRNIVNQMEEKGLNAELTFEEKVASIRKYNDLQQVEEAVKMASSGHVNIASVSEDTPGNGAVDDLTSFCLGG